MYRAAGGLKEINHVEYHVAPRTSTSSFNHTNHLVGWLSFPFQGEQSEHGSGSYAVQLWTFSKPRHDTTSDVPTCYSVHHWLLIVVMLWIALTSGEAYCCCSVAKLCLTHRYPMDCSTPSFPILHYLQEPVQTHAHGVGGALQPSHPLPPPPHFAFGLS